MANGGVMQSAQCRPPNPSPAHIPAKNGHESGCHEGLTLAHGTNGGKTIVDDSEIGLTCLHAAPMQHRQDVLREAVFAQAACPL